MSAKPAWSMTRARVERFEHNHVILARQALVAPPALGSQRSFQVLSKFDGSAFKRVTARVRYAGDHIVLYVDEDQPPGAFNDAELRTFGDLFDRTLYDLDVRAFGSESDIDGNGRVIFLLTPVVNALTSATRLQRAGLHHRLSLRTRSLADAAELEPRRDLLRARARRRRHAELPAHESGRGTARPRDVRPRVPAHDLIRPARAGARRRAARPCGSTKA